MSTAPYPSLNPEKALIWRIVHRDNLPWILDNGLHCGNGGVQAPGWVSIGNPELIDKRANHPVPLPPGSPSTVGKRGKRNLRSFVVPHIPHDDVVLPEEVQGIRAFGSETETVAGVIARHLETMRNKHAITLEHLRMGALKGVILDADGSELVDLFDAFEITP
jgi:hypothetical protein